MSASRDRSRLIRWVTRETDIRPGVKPDGSVDELMWPGVTSKENDGTENRAEDMIEPWRWYRNG